MSVDLNEIATALDKAAAHIDTVGWFQGALYDDFADPTKPLVECRVCAIGALNMALHGTPRFPLNVQPDDMTAHDVADFLRSRIGGVELADWNDTEGRTQHEVTALLRKIAAELRAVTA